MVKIKWWKVFGGLGAIGGGYLTYKLVLKPMLTGGDIMDEIGKLGEVPGLLAESMKLPAYLDPNSKSYGFKIPSAENYLQQASIVLKPNRVDVPTIKIPTLPKISKPKVPKLW